MLDLLNRYSHGFFAIPIINVCRQHHFFTVLQQPLSLVTLAQRLKAHQGYLNIVVRLFLSMGWLKVNAAGDYELTPPAECQQYVPAQLSELYTITNDQIFSDQEIHPLYFKWIQQVIDGWASSDLVFNEMLDGVVVVPLLLAMKQKQWLPLELDAVFDLSDLAPGSRQLMMQLFSKKGWIMAHDHGAQLTRPGQFIFERIFNTGVNASYRPMLEKIEQVLFADPAMVFCRDEYNHELHIDRTLNVIASGFQHEKFFSDIESWIIEVFNQPIYEQPDYIADMGCGDGSLLKRIFKTIANKTERGKLLKQYPLYLVGVDYNEKALIATKNTLKPYPHIVLKGDIGDPETLMKDLATVGVKDLDKILHVRSFLDHDRPFIQPKDSQALKQREQFHYDGCFTQANGELIPPVMVVQNLVEHLKRWKNVLGKHGLMVLEVFCLLPETIQQYFDQNESFHFDASQAFSGQWLVAAKTFITAAAECGLFPRNGFINRYPKTLPYTRILLNWFEKRPYCIRHPQFEDVAALIELESVWPSHLRLSKQEIERRLSVDLQTHYVIEMDARVVGVIYAQRIQSVVQLKETPFSWISTLHDEAGEVLQLLSINVLPEYQGKCLGDQLLSFVLQTSVLDSRIKTVTGITRCNQYVNHRDIEYQNYIKLRDEKGRLLDPIPRFHESHGARLLSVIADYRPEDVENDGNGILIQYDLQCMQIDKISENATALQPCIGESDNVEKTIIDAIHFILGEKRIKAYGKQRPLMEMGLDSMDLMELRLLLNHLLNTKLEPAFFFQYNTPETIIHFFDPSTQVQVINESQKDYTDLLENQRQINEKNRNENEMSTAINEPIAIIGLACRFPGGANTPDAFWQLLDQGIDTVEEVPAERWHIDDYVGSGSIKTRYGSFIDRVDEFDADFFRITPKEAASMDPQQRILLELNWEALEHAGIAADKIKGQTTGVFVGLFGRDYEYLQIKNNHDADYNAYFSTGNAPSMAAGRIAYYLGLHGPALTLDTACSSSLTAVHTACQSLRLNECNMALVSAVNLLLSPELSMAFSDAGMLAKDGRCKTFDQAADGYVRGEGGGTLVLKKLSAALADHDSILAVIKGSAMNQDGASNGLTAPNGLAQQAVIKAALRNADVNAQDVSYIEAHGTGTSLGDPIEMSSIAAHYSQVRTADKPLIVGSVKTNIGHLEAAAGMAGLFKIILAMQHKKIPRHLHFKTPNPHLNLAQIPALIPVDKMDWHPGSGQLTAAISSFGFSGSNVHMILQKPASQKLPDSPFKTHLLTLSAPNEKILNQLLQRYRFYLNETDDALAAICATSHNGRTHFKQRLAIVAKTHQEAIEQLDQAVMLKASQTHSTVSKMAFLFTGQGSQSFQMAKQLYDTHLVFREVMDQCAEILSAELDLPLLDIIYHHTDVQLIHQTQYTQPALFAVEYALARLWQSWGIKPDVVLGHSVGEYVAACVAGVFSLQDGLKLIAARGRLMQSLPLNGAMLAVKADVATVRQQIEANLNQVDIAAINGPTHVVISGLKSTLEVISENLGLLDIKCSMLQVSHAFHSPLMEPILAAFAVVAQSVQFQLPTLPFISNLSGKQAGSEVTTADYWIQHIRKPVLFADGIHALASLPCDMMLEIGPRPILLGMAGQCLNTNALLLPSLKPAMEDRQVMLESLAQLYMNGVDIHWQQVDGVLPYRSVSLPVYPFQRQKFWFESKADQISHASTVMQAIEQGDVSTLTQIVEQSPLATGAISTETMNVVFQALLKHHQAQATQPTWLHYLRWKKSFHMKRADTLANGNKQIWLIFCDHKPLAVAIEAKLTQLNYQVIMVTYGRKFERVSANQFCIRPGLPLDFQQLMALLKQPIYGIAYLGSVNRKDLFVEHPALSVTLLLQQLYQKQPSLPGKLFLVTRSSIAITAEESINIADVELWGLGKVIALEAPDAWGGLIDIDDVVIEDYAHLASELVVHGLLNSMSDHVAFRGDGFYTATLKPLPPLKKQSLTLDHHGTYMVTGALGAIGQVLVKWLIAKGAKHLVLLSRSAPAEAVLHQLQQHHIHIVTKQVDLAQRDDLANIFQQIAVECPPLKGLFHAAGVLDDKLLLEQTKESFTKTSQAKILGSWHLHQLSQALTLDYFVCFSSIASAIGISGQSNYAAANAFMDGLMQYRCQQGLAGLSVQWGPWQGSGMAAKHQQRFEAQGIKMLKADQYLHLLEQLMAHAPAYPVMVCDIDWPVYQAQLPSQHCSTIIPSVKPLVEIVAQDMLTLDIIKQLNQTEHQDRLPALKRFLCQQVALVTQLDENQIDEKRGFADLGLDSIMVLALRNRLSACFNTQFPPTLAIEYPNINTLSKYIAQSVLKWSELKPLTPKQSTVSAYTTNLDQTVAAIGQLSEAESEDAIAKELAELNLLLLDD